MKIIGKIIAVLYSIVFFIVLTVLLTSSFALNFLSPSYYSNVIKSVDLKEMKAADFGEFFKGANLDDDATVEDALVKALDNGEIDKQIIIDAINNKKVKEIIGKYLGEYVNFTVTGERPNVDKKDIEAVFEQPEVKKLFEQSPEEIDIDKVYNLLNTAIDQMMEGGNNDDGSSERDNNVNIPY